MLRLFRLFRLWWRECWSNENPYRYRQYWQHLVITNEIKAIREHERRMAGGYPYVAKMYRLNDNLVWVLCDK